MKQINLYQVAFLPKRVLLPASQLLLAAAALAAAVLVFYGWQAWRLAHLREEVASVSAQATQLESRANSALQPADPKVLREAERTEGRLHNLQLAQEALASGALGSETGYSTWFRALARARVEGAWLTRVEIAAGGKEMSLRGRALSGEEGARLIASLRREPLFVGLSFATLTFSPGTEPGRAAGDATASPHFLEFALNTRVEEKRAAAATSAAAPQAGGMPAMVTLPELLAKQQASQKAAQETDQQAVQQAMQGSAGGTP